MLSTLTVDLSFAEFYLSHIYSSMYFCRIGLLYCTYCIPYPFVVLAIFVQLQVRYLGSLEFLAVVAQGNSIWNIMETMSQARSCRGHGSNAPKRKFCMVLLPNRITNLEIYIGKEGSCPSKVLALTGFAPSPQSMSSSCVLALNRTCIHELAHLGKI